MTPVSFFAWPFNDPRQYSIPDVIKGNQVLWTRPSYSKTPLSFISQKEKPVTSGDFPRSVCNSTFSCHFPPPQIHGLRHSQPCSNRADQIKKRNVLLSTSPSTALFPFCLFAPSIPQTVAVDVQTPYTPVSRIYRREFDFYPCSALSSLTHASDLSNNRYNLLFAPGFHQTFCFPSPRHAALFPMDLPLFAFWIVFSQTFQLRP